MRHYYILYLVAIMLALSSTFLTVHGITQVFAGSAFFVAIIGVILELGKYSTMWSLTKNWSDKAYRKIRWVMAIIVCFLTILSSAGIFSYYATSYVKGNQSIADVVSEVKIIESQIKESNNQVEIYRSQQSELLSSQKQIIDGLVAREYLTRANNIRKQNQEEVDILREKIETELKKQDELNKNKIQLQKQISQIKKDSGFISHVASTVGIDIETDADAEFKVVLILICIILFALEPLSIFSMVMGHIDRRKWLGFTDKKSNNIGSLSNFTVPYTTDYSNIKVKVYSTEEEQKNNQLSATLVESIPSINLDITSTKEGIEYSEPTELEDTEYLSCEEQIANMSDVIISFFEQGRYQDISYSDICKLRFTSFYPLKESHKFWWFIKDHKWTRKHRNIYLDDDLGLIYFITERFAYVYTYDSLDDELVYQKCIARHNDKPVNI